MSHNYRLLFSLLLVFFCGVEKLRAEPIPLDTIVSDTIRDPANGTLLLYVFRPAHSDKKLPCVLFCPRFGGDNPIEYRGLVEHLVRRGTVVVFPTYATRVFTRRSIEVGLRTDDVFSLVSHTVKSLVDTSRLGFVGHSYGAGILPAIAEKVVARAGWGANGTFLYMMSPWYFPGTSARELAHFPANVSVLVQVFSGDNINDPRIGSNFFQMLNLPAGQKEFCIVNAPEKASGERRVKSDFQVPLSVEAPGGADDILDTVALLNMVDSLCAGVFDKSSTARTFVFGSGTTRRVALDHSADTSFCMIMTDTPKPYLPKLPYINSWLSPRNPFVDVTAFRKARRMYAGFKRDKISNTLSYAADKKKKERDDDSLDVDILPNPLDTGFGSDGPFSVRVDTVVTPGRKDDPAYLFRPAVDSLCRWPIVILLHGYSGQDYSFFEPYISHCVSRGYAVIYPTYPILPVASSASRVEEKIDIVRKGIDAVCSRFSLTLDSTRVGIAGQSFGGGMVPAIGKTLFVERKWGSEGAFLFMTAPWYCHGITDTGLASFPQRVKMLVMIFDEDQINDHAMAVDIFKSIALPQSEKNFITLFSDSIAGQTMRADHFVPYGRHYIYGQENLLDYYGVYRFGDALAAYAFNGSAAGKNIALGTGTPEQCSMGKRIGGLPLKPAEVTRTPFARHAQTDYFYPWDNPLNPRKSRMNASESAVVPIDKR